MRILVTGIAGFAGSHLAEYLARNISRSLPEEGDGHIEIHGIIHRHDGRIQHINDQLILHRGDLRNALWVSELVQTIQPDYTLHLAAWSNVGGSWDQPWTTYELNIQCQLNLLEAIRRWSPQSRTLIVSSNEVYGLIKEIDLPVNEETPFRPNSPYGVSKVTQDMMAQQYWISYELPIIRVRSFNHLGPGQSDDFVASAFARQIIEIEAGLREPIVRVGNLSAKRDFTDVRDVVRAYWLALTKALPGSVFNVGSGQAHSIRKLLDLMLELTPANVDIQIDPARLRPSDVPISLCDNQRLVNATGWQPQYKLRDTLHDLLESWRERIYRTLAEEKAR